MRIDLHCHSNASDGTEPPEQVMHYAAAAGLDVVALTDHDTTAGWRRAAEALPPGLALVPGMELSCRRDGMSIHMLAYLFDPTDPELAAECARIRDSREQRGRHMVVRLVRAAGGVTVLAHPKAGRRGKVVPDEWIAELANEGLFGIEVDHADHDKAARDHVRSLATDLGLAVTGSSDDHGTLTGHRLGSETTHPTVYERLLTEATGAMPVTALGAEQPPSPPNARPTTQLRPPYN